MSLLLLLSLAASGGSKLAPQLSYAGRASVHSFLHGFDQTPKVILLRPAPLPPDADGEATSESEPPSWFTSVAMAFKEGRKKSVSFAMLQGEDAAKVASRLGIRTELGLSGVVVGFQVDGKYSGTFSVFDGYLGEGSGKVGSLRLPASPTK